MADISVRLAEFGDIDAMTAVTMRSKRSNGYDDAFMALCVDELSVTAERLRDRTYWVAEDGKVCGLVSVEPISNSGIGEVHAFFVDPTMKRKGVGRLLWQQVLEHAETENLTALELDSDPDAVPFYEAMGFETVGESPSGSIPGRVLPRMKIEL